MKTILALIITLYIRACVSLWKYSGQGKPPMFGDLEAQRHWMEITVNLPVSEWYVDGPFNDLQYWGLDYPPLTSYHMMINGKVAKLINSSMVTLKESHGIEDQVVTLFMRSTVLFMDALLFLPAVAIYFMCLRPAVERDQDLLGYIILLAAYPGLLLIDNGHFQYNNVSLGLFVLAVLAIQQGRDLVAALLFCCALNYKQMELYHALPFFAYLLSRCLKAELCSGVLRLIKLGLTVITTFAVIWSPFLTSKDSLLAVVTRLFPLKRGVYEDKVASFWCSISVFVKIKELIPDRQMALICLIATGVLCLPSFLHLLRKPSVLGFLYSLVNTSLVFFLFSFHVHEKTILLAAIPCCLLVRSDPTAVFWFLLVSVFSMLPLLLKDGLLIPTIATVGLFFTSVNHFLNPLELVSQRVKLLFQMSMLGAVLMTLAAVCVAPPQRYPDIFPLLISVYSCAHFMLFCVYFHIRQFRVEKMKVV